MTNKQIVIREGLRILGSTQYSYLARNDMLFGLYKLVISLDLDSDDMMDIWDASKNLARNNQ